MPIYKNGLKRVLDCAISALGLLVAAIPMGLIAIAVKLDSPGPVIFRQQRLGKDGRVFDMLKFRSMCLNAEHSGSGVYSEKGDKRVTRVGRILRATSLDELPEVYKLY